MTDYVELSKEQSEYVVDNWLGGWPQKEKEEVKKKTWIIKFADQSWEYHKNYPYVLGYFDPVPEDPEWWEVAGRLSRKEFKEIMKVGA